MKCWLVLCVTLLPRMAVIAAEERAVSPVLRFNWPSPARFQVEEKISMKGTRMDILYSLSFTPTNGGYVLQWDKAEVLTVNGKPVEGDERKAMEPVENMFRHPSFLIAADGSFVETLLTKETIARVNTNLDQALPDRSAEVRESFEKWGASETGKTMMDNAYSQVWDAWVWAWADTALAAGESVTNKLTVPFVGKTMLPTTAVLRNLGSVKNQTNLVHLKHEQVQKGRSIGASLTKLFRQLGTDFGMKPGESLPKKVSFEMATTLEIQTDTKTLQPRWAKRTIVKTISVPREEKGVDLEVHEYNFRWTAP